MSTDVKFINLIIMIFHRATLCCHCELLAGIKWPHQVSNLWWERSSRIFFWMCLVVLFNDNNVTEQIRQLDCWCYLTTPSRLEDMITYGNLGWWIQVLDFNKADRIQLKLINLKSKVSQFNDSLFMIKQLTKWQSSP